MDTIAEAWILGCVKKGSLDYSDHAKKRMIEREIEDFKIIDCILHGKVIEHQKWFKKDVHVLFQEATDNKPEMYVIVAAAYPYPRVVSVCRTMDEVWEVYNGLLIRRKKR